MGRPKLIDTWYYDVKDLEVIERVPEDDEAEERKRVITKKVEVKVLLEKETCEEGGPPYSLTSCEFTVKCDDPKFAFVGTDIEHLRSVAWAELNNKFKIKWEPYYLVKVRAESVYEGMGQGLTFSYDDVYKGTTWDGKLLLRQHQFRGEDRISAWPGRFTDKDGKAVACIEHNEANTEALEEFSRRIGTLRNRLRDTLKPEVIMQTLQNMTALALLPPAPEEKEKE